MHPQKSVSSVHRNASRGTNRVECDTLENMLAGAGRAREEDGRIRVDFWSLDVEGHELTVLGVPGWEERVRVRALLVEDVGAAARPDQLDMLLSRRGYVKAHQLHVDSLYTLRGEPLPRKFRYAANFEERWEDVLEGERKRPGARGRG